jgi:hypothetical protein
MSQAGLILGLPELEVEHNDFPPTNHGRWVTAAKKQ